MLVIDVNNSTVQKCWRQMLTIRMFRNAGDNNYNYKLWRAPQQLSADQLALGVSDLIVHPVPPSSLDAQTVQILRFSDSQILSFLRFSGFSERLLEPDYLYREQSGRSTLC